MSKLVSLAVSGAVLAVSTGAFGASATLQKDVTLVIDGSTKHVSTMTGTVAELLKSEKLSVSEHDVVAPAINAPVRNGGEIAVLYGRPVDATIDGNRRSLWTTARTVNDFLAQFAIRAEGSRLSTSRSTTIGREGLALSIDVAKQVTVKQGDTTKVVTIPGKVSDALAASGITLGDNDRVRPAADQDLVDGETINIVKVEKRQYTKTVDLPYDKTTKDDPSLPEGTNKVTQQGQDGSHEEIWEQILENGVVVSDSKIGDGSTKDAIPEVTSKGTKSADAPAASTNQSSSTPASTPAAPAAVPSGSHADWMAAAGISPSDFQYVEALIARESGWNPNARNSGSGACGLVQALPCSKLGPNWNNPVVALQWANSYVSRYGGWAGAWAHSQSYGWY